MSDFEIAPIGDFDTTEVLQLPSQEGSSKAVRLRRPDVLQLLIEGNVPEPLTEQLLGAMNQQTANGKTKKHSELFTRDNLPQLLRFANTVAIACFVEPPLTDEPDSSDTHLSVHHVPFGDKIWLINWALGDEGVAVQSFRDEQMGRDEPVLHERGAGRKTK